MAWEQLEPLDRMDWEREWGEELQEELRRRGKAGDPTLTINERRWYHYDFTDRPWEQPSTRDAWIRVVNERADKGDTAKALMEKVNQAGKMSKRPPSRYDGIRRMKKRRSTHKKKKKKPIKKYCSRRRKHTKRR